MLVSHCVSSAGTFYSKNEYIYIYIKRERKWFCNTICGYITLLS